MDCFVASLLAMTTSPPLLGMQAALPQSLIYHEAACDLQLSQSAREEAFRRRMDIAKRSQLELADDAAGALEWRQQASQADRRMRAAVERQQQQLERQERAALVGCGE